MCIDYGIELPDKGLIEFLGYPQCGMSILLQEMCRANKHRKILYAQPYGDVPYLGNHVTITNARIIEIIGNTIVTAAENGDIDMVILDALPDFVSQEELSVVETVGFEGLNTATTANVWFNVLRILREEAMDHELLLIIGNIRKTRLPSRIKKGYLSTYPRESAQSMDLFTFLTIYMEVVRRKVTKQGVNLMVDHWTERKEQKGLPIPIHAGAVRHDIEKCIMLASEGVVRKVGSDAFLNNGERLSYQSFLTELGDEYSLEGMERFKEE